MNHFDPLQFYGIDWTAMVMMFVSLYALGLKKRSGFVFGGVGCACWIIFGTMVGSIADMTANTICLFMNVIGFIRWSNTSPNSLS